MSLKAKLEAVIYAAEEPVTLAQLAVLFASDALEWKAQREAVSVEQAAEAASEAAHPLLANEEFAYLDLEPPPADFLPPGPASSDAAQEQAAETMPEASQEAGLEASPEPNAEVVAEIEPETGLETGPTGEPSGLPATENEPAPAEEADAGSEEANARRQARLRDREVRAILRELLDELVASSASDGRGVEIREIAGGYRMATKPECHDAVRLFVKSLKPALRLSLPALETLAVIAYKQPVTAPEVNEIRGVDSSGVFGSLLARKLIATAGRKPVIGRPILYKTTREFLLRFGLKDVFELPSMEEFEKMAVLELDEPEPATGEESERRSNPALGPEFDEAASEELEDSPSEGLVPQAAPQTVAQAGEPASEEAPTNSPAIPAEPTPAEAAPAAPSPQEQAETESLPHGE
jgi:segregation and condensation protein B